MIVRVKLFAVARQRMGKDELEVDVSPSGASASTVADLRAALKSQFPGLADLLPHVRVAVNNEYATEKATIPESAELALIPPVSGG